MSDPNLTKQEFQVLPDLLDYACNEYSKRTMFRYKTEYRTFIWKYSNFYNFVLRVSSLLHSSGVKKGEKVFIYAPNSVQWSAVAFASSLLGAITVPIDILANKEYIQAIQNEVSGKVIFTSQFKPINIPGVKSFFMEDLLDMVEEYEPASKEVLQQNKPKEDDLLQLVYTSGTTGDPKGVMLTHKNVISNLKAVREDSNLPDRQKFLSILPMSHMFEYTIGFLLPIYTGGTIVYIETRKPNVITRTIKQERINAIISVPDFLDAIQKTALTKAQESGKGKLFDAMLKVSKKLYQINPKNNSIRRKVCWPLIKAIGPQLKYFGVGGAALDPKTEEFYVHAGYEILKGYGLTETSPVLALSPIGMNVIGKVGVTLNNVKVKIAPDGEIIAYGPSVTQGYYLKPEKTREAFSDNWFLTGDIGTLEEMNGRNYLTITDRKKNMIIIGGLNVYPIDIEQKLNLFKQVDESCVIGIGDDSNAKIHAVILPKESLTQSEAEEIVRTLNKDLLSHQQILSVSIWPEREFPKTSTRKIKKNIVKETVIKDAKRKKTETVHRPKLESPKLYQIIAEVAGIEASEITADSVLTELGVDSLGILEVASGIENEFDIEMDENKLNAQTTVSDLEKILIESQNTKNELPLSTWQYSDTVKPIRRAIVNTLINPVLDYFCRTEAVNIHKIDGVGQCIFIANHVSTWDIPVINQTVPTPYRNNLGVLASAQVVFGVGDEKAGFFKKLYKRLLASYFTRLAYGTLPLPEDRVRKSFQLAGNLIDRGLSLFIFPEGKRTLDGNMFPFQNGAAFLTKVMGLPVVPIYIKGLYEVLPVQNFIPKRGKVEIIYGNPLRFKNADSVEDIAYSLEMSIKILENKHRIY